jgi:hypothetical protein
MNKIDDILEQLKGQRPVIDDPDELTERIMESLPEQEAQPTATTEGTKPGMRRQNRHTQTVPLWRWLSIAASILLIIGIGLHYAWNESPRSIAQSSTVDSTTEHARLSNRARLINQSGTVNQSIGHGQSINRGAPTTSSGRPNHLIGAPQPPHRGAPVEEPATPDSDPNLHYASNELTKDTVPYQDPARVDSFIARLAAYYDVRQGELECTQPAGSNVVSSVYVFPDKQEINVFNRLLQVACWYSDETPGYFLNFSHQQFFFELKDLRRQLQYRWIADRINGKILLYGTHAPLGTKESSACYQEYRDELMHTKSIRTKTLDI